MNKVKEKAFEYLKGKEVKYKTRDLRMSFFINDVQRALDIAIEESYKEGFRDGLDACKPNKKLDKAIKEGTEL